MQGAGPSYRLVGRKGLAPGVKRGGGGGWLAGWLEVFSQIVEVDTLLLPAPLPASLALLRSPRERERGREREGERKRDIEQNPRLGMDLRLQQSAAREE